MNAPNRDDDVGSIGEFAREQMRLSVGSEVLRLNQMVANLMNQIRLNNWGVIPAEIDHVRRSLASVTWVHHLLERRAKP